MPEISVSEIPVNNNYVQNNTSEYSTVNFSPAEMAGETPIGIGINPLITLDNITAELSEVVANLQGYDYLSSISISLNDVADVNRIYIDLHSETISLQDYQKLNKHIKLNRNA